MLHEALVFLFRQRPELACEVLGEILGIELPPHAAVRVEDASLPELEPTEYRADLVVVLSDERPVLGIVVEVQLARDPGKHVVWPLYAAQLRARLGAPTCVLVVTPEESVARWASQPIVIGPVQQTFVPFVMGPGAVPVVDDVDAARRAPEMAVLSALAYGKTERGIEVALAAVGATLLLDADRNKLYTDMVYAAVSQAARAALEALVESGKWEYQSPFVKKWMRELAEKEAEGKAEGRAEGKAEALLAVLSARGLEISPAQRARMLACRELDVLDRWIASAVSAASVADVLGD